MFCLCDISRWKGFLFHYVCITTWRTGVLAYRYSDVVTYMAELFIALCDQVNEDDICTGCQQVM